MFIKSISLASIALLMVAAALPASNAPDAQEKSAPTVSYIKPGAAIELSYDYDGQTSLGEAETVTLSISHMYSSGFLTAALMPDYGLSVITDVSAQRYSLQSGSKLTLPVQISASTAGHYSLGVEIVYESLEGYQSRRVVSVPLTIGTEALSKAQQKAPAASFKSESQKAGRTEVIGLGARETIY